MKVIILVQSIIIVLGAYYLYTLREQVSEVPTNATLELMPVIPPNRDGYVPPTEQPPVEVTEASASTTEMIGGPNDAGMEYPIQDAELQAR